MRVDPIRRTLAATSVGHTTRLIAEAAHRRRLLDAARPVLDDLVDQTELLCLARRQEFVALYCGLDHVERLAGMLDIDLVEPGPEPQDLARLDLDIGGLALGAARGLVDHDPRIGQRIALAPGAGSQQ